jgi:hypothetical protein
MGRMCTSRDVANGATYLASEAAGLITGVNLQLRASDTGIDYRALTDSGWADGVDACNRQVILAYTSD